MVHGGESLLGSFQLDGFADAEARVRERRDDRLVPVAQVRENGVTPSDSAQLANLPGFQPRLRAPTAGMYSSCTHALSA